MEHHKISKLLNDLTMSKFVTRKWIEVDDLSGTQYSASENKRFKTPMLRSGLCNYNYAYIVVKGEIAGNTNANRRNKKLNFKINAPFRSWI